MNKDKSKYVIIDHVPILDEHILVDNDGKKITVDEQVLQRIAANNNKRILDTGDETPIVIGHTQDNIPEAQQPKIVGYASKFRVAPLGKTGRKALVCMFKLFSNLKNLWKQYPRRSVELWLNKWFVDPISLLGATTPERDLGLIRFAANNQDKICITYAAKGYSMDKEQLTEIAQAVVALLRETEEWKFLSELKEEADRLKNASQQDADEPKEQEGLEMKEQAPEEETLQEDEEDKKKYAVPEFPSGSNTFVPRFPRREYSSSELHHRIRNLEKANQALKLKLARTEREAALRQLLAEGYDFDLEEELQDAMEQPTDKQFNKQINRIKKRYSKLPGVDPEVFAHSVSSTEKGKFSKEQMDKAIHYAVANNIPYEKAMELYKK